MAESPALHRGLEPVRALRAGQAATVLVHEACDLLGNRMPFHDHGNFLSAAAEAMRRVLIERAQRLSAAKRDRREGAAPVHQEMGATARATDPGLVIDIGRGLQSLSPEQIQLIDLRYFAGFSLEETAKVMRLEPETVDKRWQVVKTHLYDRLEHRRSHDSRSTGAARPDSRGGAGPRP